MQLMGCLRFFKSSAVTQGSGAINHCSRLPHTNTKLSAIAANKTAAMIQELINTPLTWQMINNCIPEETLRRFIKQEEAKDIIITKLSPHYAASFTTPNRSTSQNERELLNSFKKKFQIGLYNETIHPATQAYSEYLVKTARHQSVACGIAATLPCYQSYMRLGEFIAQQMTPNNPYIDWAKNYTSPEFRNAAKRQTLLFDTLANKAAPHVKQKMIEHYEQSLYS
jgi:thiaminase